MACAGDHVMLFGEKGPLPFDVAPLRTVPMRWAPMATPEPAAGVAAVTRFLDEARRTKDSRQDSRCSKLSKACGARHRAAEDRCLPRAAVRRDAATGQRGGAAGRGEGRGRRAGRSSAAESGVMIDLLLSYRAVSDWQGMVDLVAA